MGRSCQPEQAPTQSSVLISHQDTSTLSRPLSLPRSTRYSMSKLPGTTHKPYVLKNAILLKGAIKHEHIALSMRTS